MSAPHPLRKPTQQIPAPHPGWEYGTGCGNLPSIHERSWCDPETLMADGDLYQTDILAWSEQQTGALRELAARRDLPNALDLAHVVEEIEDVGQSELNAVRSFLRLILGHAIKCQADPEAPSVRHWLVEIGNWQNELADRLTPSMRHRVDLDVLWGRAMRQAKLELAEHDRLSAEVLARLAAHDDACPVALDDLLADPAALVARLG